MDGHEEICTTIFNLGEISSVLSRKYRWKSEEIGTAIEAIEKKLSVLITTEYDVLDAYQLSLKLFLTPIDAVLLSASKNNELTLITFDSWLLSYDSKGFSVKSP